MAALSRTRRPLIGITMGDPAGIGPEIALRALASRRVRAAGRYVVYGSASILERVASQFRLRLPAFVRAQSAAEAKGAGPFLCEPVACPAKLALRGKPLAAAGAASVAWVAAGAADALAGRIAALVTAPISKQAVAKAGFRWPGHTELLAAATGVEKPVMMMAGAGLRVALVTTHAAVGRLPRLVTRRNVLQTIRVTNRDLRRFFGLRRPRIAVCGLNPHAGEAGRFGLEERKAIAPAVRAARRAGIRCDGPIPADVAFTPACLAGHDAIVAMFHDQATIPVKMLAFHSGVNLTLGLPIIRTSPDHGVAWDIVRRGAADPGSMIAAILMAARMAGSRRR